MEVRRSSKLVGSESFLATTAGGGGGREGEGRRSGEAEEGGLGGELSLATPLGLWTGIKQAESAEEGGREGDNRLGHRKCLGNGQNQRVHVRV